MPRSRQLLADIRQATTTTGRTRDLDGFNLDAYDYAPSATQRRRFPTVKVDYNLTTNQRLSGTYRFNEFNSNPDFLNSAEAPFPGFPTAGHADLGPLQLLGEPELDLRQVGQRSDVTA